MEKYKIGQKYVANSMASTRFTVTKEGWIGTVIEIGDEIKLESMDKQEYFYFDSFEIETYFHLYIPYNLKGNCNKFKESVNV